MQIQTNSQRKEVKEHGTYSFPVMVSYETLNAYENASFFWHWHPEIELTLILEGDIQYQIQEHLYHLHAGQGIFCNSNMLHTGKRGDSDNCIYISITFHPRILYGFESSVIQSKYVTPITENPNLSSILFLPEVPWQKQILEEMASIWELSGNPPDTLELQLQQRLLSVWGKLCEHVNMSPPDSDSLIRSRLRLHQILSYIQEHYQEKLTLEEISAQIHLCKSECCRFFKSQMKVSLFQYLLRYRIEQSLPLLQDTELSITEIALQTGFSNPCYYGKIFKEEMNCTPRQYRRKTSGGK